MIEKLKKRWNVESNWQIAVIFLVFSVTGSASMMIRRPFMDLIGVERGVTSAFIYWPASILSIFVFYQITLVFVGALFGQFKFFWAFEKKMLRRFGFKSLK